MDIIAIIILVFASISFVVMLPLLLFPKKIADILFKITEKEFIKEELEKNKNGEN